MSKKAGTPDPTNIMTPTDDNKPEPPAAAPQAAAPPVVDMTPVIEAIESGFQSLDKTVKGIKFPNLNIPTPEPKKTEGAPTPTPEPPPPPKPEEKKYRWFDEFDPF